MLARTLALLVIAAATGSCYVVRPVGPPPLPEHGPSLSVTVLNPVRMQRGLAFELRRHGLRAFEYPEAPKAVDIALVVDVDRFALGLDGGFSGTVFAFDQAERCELWRARFRETLRLDEDEDAQDRALAELSRRFEIHLRSIVVEADLPLRTCRAAPGPSVLVIEISGAEPDAVKLSVDGRRVPSAREVSVPLEVGVHRVVAISGGERFERDVEVSERGTTRLGLRLAPVRIDRSRHAPPPSAL